MFWRRWIWLISPTFWSFFQFPPLDFKSDSWNQQLSRWCMHLSTRLFICQNTALLIASLLLWGYFCFEWENQNFLKWAAESGTLWLRIWSRRTWMNVRRFWTVLRRRMRGSCCLSESWLEKSRPEKKPVEKPEKFIKLLLGYA